ncbi:MAG TPA: hypothetical protein VJL86_07915 [Steroidobacteraceae bacterium]|nr:hypothetical protein [Steroidobacteraceae bacterium]
MATSDNGSSRNKIWLGVVGIVVLAGVAYVADIYPPADESLTGSIVPAERYRAEKSATSSSRLVLGDESVAQFMQTDLYRQIVNDRELAAIFASDGFRQALASDGFRAALASDNFKQALASDNFKQAMANDNFRQALASDQFRAALAQDALRAASQSQ